MATKKTTRKTAPKRASNKERLSQLDAAAKVLASAKQPMGCKDLIAAMAKRKLWTSPGGKTPDATLYAAFLREIGKGKDSRFKKAAPGKFALRK